MKKIEKKYKFAVIATDVAIFTIKEGELKILLLKMKKKPYENSWALPGGLIRGDEPVNKSAERHLFEKTGLKNMYLEQLYTFGDVNRDPFGRVVSVSYFALLSDSRLKPIAKRSEVEWFSVNDLPKLAYDHKEIIATAVERLRSKLEYTNIVYSLLPNEFSLSDLQKTYEIILNKKLDKRNFRKKILSLGIIKKTDKIEIGGAHRPAALYKFIDKKVKLIEIL